MRRSECDIAKDLTDQHMSDTHGARVRFDAAIPQTSKPRRLQDLWQMVSPCIYPAIAKLSGRQRKICCAISNFKERTSWNWLRGCKKCLTLGSAPFHSDLGYQLHKYK